MPFEMVYLYINVNQTFGIGTSHEFALNWLLEGPESGYMPYPTTSQSISIGWDLGIEFGLGFGRFIGQIENIRMSQLFGNRSAISLSPPGMPFSGGGSLSYNEMGLRWETINFGVSFGLSQITGYGRYEQGYTFPLYNY